MNRNEITDRIYNVYNGLFGKKISEMLDDPHIDKFVENGIEKEYVSTAKGNSFLIPYSIFRKPEVVKKMMIWDENLQKYVRATKAKYLYYRLNELKSLIVFIQELSKTSGKFTKKTCPLEMLDDHYRLSRILSEDGSYKWNCPFCNTEFQESTMLYKNT